MIAPLQMRRCMYITSSQLTGRNHPLLNDTGAMFSAISMKLVHDHRLHIRRPQQGETQHLAMADKTKIVRRIGTVTIPITVHFSGGAYHKPYECTKSFEVLDMDYDFILGVDIRPRLFPSDDIMNYLLLPSRISSPPMPLNSIELTNVGEAHVSAISQFADRVTLEYCDTSIATAPSHHATAINEYVGERVCDYYVKMCSLDGFVSATRAVAAAPHDNDSVNVRVDTATKQRHVSTSSSPSPSVSVCVDTNTSDRMVTTTFSDIYENVNSVRASSSSSSSSSSPSPAAATAAATDVSDDGVISLSQQVGEMGACW